MRKLAIEVVMELDRGLAPAEVVAAWKRLSASDQCKVINEAMRRDLKTLGFSSRSGKRAPRKKVRRGIGSY